MKYVVLIFPDTTLLSTFILVNKIKGEIKTSNHSLEAFLTDEQIVTACTGYKAELVKINNAIDINIL